MFMLLLTFAGCGDDAATTAPSPPPAASSAPAPAPAPPPVAITGPPGADGPESIVVPALTLSSDPAVVARGQKVFKDRGCGACHQFGTKLVGPDLVGVTQRRSVTWIARQIAAPERMTREDPVAKQLYQDLMVQMTNQKVPPDELAPLISYLASEGPAKP